ncbi:Protein of unknown function [Robiginitalea myxolifaciens]|uniref:DUF4242 domain-containing protein n=1 Tax=Robiginitalea myxolifaciens TaxID=400055 RepID=A0A1I6FXU5_9FLAO|nr:DUF4242 domain-containing protein [Robiginitalea myxolifaciens]SFR34720.1 Protein of unknown function [Robiginitalea myxolifaciens]
MKMHYLLSFLLVVLAGHTTLAQTNTNTADQAELKTYVIERVIPNAGDLSAEELQGISKKSNEVLFEMGSGIEWLHSYVTDDKVICVYKAENEELLKEHAAKGGFPINNIRELSTVISPATAED